MIVKTVLAATKDITDIYQPAQAMGGASATIATLFNPIVANVITVSGIIALATIIFSGFQYVTGAGDKNKIAQAQNMLSYGILGIIVVTVAFVLTRIIGTLLGFTFF